VFALLFSACSDASPSPSRSRSPSPDDLPETQASDFKYGYDAALGGIVINEYIGTTIKVRIPEKIEGETVKAIGNGAFAGAGIAYVYIPDGVTSIGHEVFIDCKGLTSVTLPDGVTSIGSYAFSGTPNLAVTFKGFGFKGNEAITAVALSEMGYEQMQFGGYNWAVLDRAGNSVLLLSMGVLENRPYHEPGGEITWENSTTRQYLNGDFYNGFDAGDRSRIADTRVVNGDNPDYGTPGGNDTTDKVFLLSIDEVNLYLSNVTARIAYNANGNTSYWWLRSPGFDSYYAAIVYDDGNVSGDGFFYGGGGYGGGSAGVRPAMWITP
jgi:hypothetical protein